MGFFGIACGEPQNDVGEIPSSGSVSEGSPQDANQGETPKGLFGPLVVNFRMTLYSCSLYQYIWPLLPDLVRLSSVIRLCKLCSISWADIKPFHKIVAYVTL